MWKTTLLYKIILLSLELHVIRIWIQYPLSFIDIGKGLMCVSCWKILTLFVTLYGFWCKPALTMVILLLHLKAMFPFSFLFFKFISVGMKLWFMTARIMSKIIVMIFLIKRQSVALPFCSFKNKQKTLKIPWHIIYSKSAVKGQGPRISLGDYEHESWLLHRKQKENITERTSQLFRLFPTY